MTDTYNLDRRPPCWPVGEQCPNSCAADLHRRGVTNHVELTGHWAGWRLAGCDLVAPSGERIPERRLRGLLWHANANDIRASVRRRNAKRKAVQHSMVKVVVVDLGQWRERHFGKIAGQDVGALRYRFIRTAHQPTLEPSLAGGLTLSPQSAEQRRGHRADPRRSCAARELARSHLH